ncbi:acyl-CoA dehydrogenase family protein [Mycobacterium sp. UM_CSW]|uniref:acyl-CoA dehydrogenase family protein n=1 Tax=Mycobacterium sp. UM_CSW TaxID=1370119 RepID=UPI00082AAADE|nr:acyl-CoA dehydrogenase family protein [Mycobacterium sp. UM_CSW]
MKLPVEPELESLRAAIAARAKSTVRPLAAQVDREQKFSWELWAAVRELGLSRIHFPEDHGGDGGTFRAYTIASTEPAEYCAVASLYPGTSIQVAMALLQHGNPEHSRRFFAFWAAKRCGLGLYRAVDRCGFSAQRVAFIPGYMSARQAAAVDPEAPTRPTSRWLRSSSSLSWNFPAQTRRKIPARQLRPPMLWPSRR